MRGIGSCLSDQLVHRVVGSWQSVDCQVEISVGVANAQVGGETGAPLQFVHMRGALEVVPGVNALFEQIEGARVMLNRSVQ